MDAKCRIPAQLLGLASAILVISVVIEALESSKYYLYITGQHALQCTDGARDCFREKISFPFTERVPSIDTHE